MVAPNAHPVSLADIKGLAAHMHIIELPEGEFLVQTSVALKRIRALRAGFDHRNAIQNALAVLGMGFQGLDDEVVPPNQAEAMFAVMRARGLPTAYLSFEGEGHGFRRAENIKRSLDAELYFYSRIFGFELADPVEPVHIENL